MNEYLYKYSVLNGEHTFSTLLYERQLCLDAESGLQCPSCKIKSLLQHLPAVYSCMYLQFFLPQFPLQENEGHDKNSYNKARSTARIKCVSLFEDRGVSSK